MKKNGFTIIEVSIAATIGTMVLIIVYMSFIAGQKMHQRSVLNAELAQNGRIALDRMTREIRQTNEIVTILSETPPDPKQSSIKFEDGHNDIIQYITYYQDGSELKRELGHHYFSGSPNEWVYSTAKDALGDPAEYEVDDTQVISQYLDYVNFYGDKTVTIEFRALHNDKDIELRTKVTGRNL